MTVLWSVLRETLVNKPQSRRVDIVEYYPACKCKYNTISHKFTPTRTASPNVTNKYTVVYVAWLHRSALAGHTVYKACLEELHTMCWKSLCYDLNCLYFTQVLNLKTVLKLYPLVSVYFIVCMALPFCSYHCFSLASGSCPKRR